jgi:hypothetical protein
MKRSLDGFEQSIPASRRFRRMLLGRRRWPDKTALLDLNRRDRLLLGHAFGNFLNIGNIGSGKSSGPHQYLTRAFVRIGAGGLFLCVKQDSADTYREWVRRDGREKDLIEFGPGFPASFNFLNFFTTKHPGDTALVVEDVLYVLTETLTLVRRRDATHGAFKDEGFFRDAADKLFRAVLVVLFAANGRLRLDEISAFLSSIPRNPDEPLSERFFAVRQIREAKAKLLAQGREAEIQMATRFLDHDWVGYAVETRESIRATAQVLIDLLTYEPLASLFGGETTVSPDDILNGKLILVTPEIHVRPAIGRISAGLWKAMVQRAVLRRTLDRDPAKVRPIFICGDEAHELVTAGDVRFVSSSRSQRAITIYTTQTITSLNEALGASATSTLLAGLKTRFICRTDDPDTTKWIRETTNEVINEGSPTSSAAKRTVDFATDGLRELCQGGPPGGVVEAVVIRGNDRFLANGRRWCRVRFRQVPPLGFFASLWQAWTTNEVRIVPKPQRAEPRESEPATAHEVALKT